MWVVLLKDRCGRCGNRFDGLLYFRLMRKFDLMDVFLKKVLLILVGLKLDIGLVFRFSVWVVRIR